MDRLAQGVVTRMKRVNEYIFFIKCNIVPSESKTTYTNIGFNYCPLKENKNCVKPTVDDDHLPYPSDVGAPTTSLLEAKII